ncbi:hypothetical protein Dimus_026560 [Dionaea muscipula]
MKTHASSGASMQASSSSAPLLRSPREQLQISERHGTASEQRHPVSEQLQLRLPTSSGQWPRRAAGGLRRAVGSGLGEHWAASGEQRVMGFASSRARQRPVNAVCGQWAMQPRCLCMGNISHAAKLMQHKKPMRAITLQFIMRAAAQQHDGSRGSKPWSWARVRRLAATLNRLNLTDK